ncbi:MAG: hypothetical protein K2W96_10770 [Gemmataceae bacterium]|nr:hypothetical protein [Gemmataceae bacterium]
MSAATRLGLACLLAALAAGCSGSGMPGKAKATPEEVAAARAGLPEADRALADEQEWCAVATKQRLGSMGVPVKVAVNGTAVLLCCSHCEKKALADAAKTLAAAEANRKRAAEERAAKRNRP